MDTTDGSPAFPLLPEVLTGETADVYFLRAREVLVQLECDPMVGVNVFAGRAGVCCGVTQVAQVLGDAEFDGELWAIGEGAQLVPGRDAMQLRGRYSSFGIYETAILGILASCSGWATAARAVVDSAGDVPVVSFGARHVHPNVAGIMDWAATIGGCVACSTPLGARLSGTAASGTMPHAFVLVVGDTLEAARAFDATMDAGVPRIVLVDTFQDEAVESVRVAGALGDTLQGVRLDTPRERGGVTPALVREIRARLDMAGFQHVQILVSGGISPDRIAAFREQGAPIDGYGVGSFISGAAPIDFTADIREIDGTPIAKRGRIPGMQVNAELRKLL